MKYNIQIIQYFTKIVVIISTHRTVKYYSIKIIACLMKNHTNLNKKFGIHNVSRAILKSSANILRNSKVTYNIE